MKIATYSTKQLSPHAYSFFSKGPKGEIELRIIITKDEEEENVNLFNLAFGAWDTRYNDIDDTAQLRNGDMDQILATVVHVALAFMKENPNSFLYAQGSNPARTRKYQMGITKFFKDIPSNLGVLGLIIENLDVKDSHSWRWDNFRTGTNYHAFLLYSK